MNPGGEAGAPTDAQASEVTGLNEMTGASGVTGSSGAASEGPGMTATAGTSGEAGTSGGASETTIDPETGEAGAPYSVVVNVNPGGVDRALRAADGTVLESGIAASRIGDPFNPAFIADIEKLASEQIAPRKHDPGLQIWYLGNEIGVFDKGAKSPSGVRDFRRYLWSACPQGSTIDGPLCAPRRPGGVSARALCRRDCRPQRRLGQQIRGLSDHRRRRAAADPLRQRL